MQVDLVGGYYDAGDNVKFGFPMAFTTTVLSWSVIEFGGVMKGELQNAREAICWGTDYVFKATAHPDTIYVQRSDVLKVYVYGVIILLRSTMSYIKISNVYLQFLMGPGAKMLFDFVKEMPKSETPYRIDIASRMGSLFFTWVILQLFPDVLKSTRMQLERELALEDISSVKDLPAYNLLR